MTPTLKTEPRNNKLTIRTSKQIEEKLKEFGRKIGVGHSTLAAMGIVEMVRIISKVEKEMESEGLTLERYFQASGSWRHRATTLPFDRNLYALLKDEENVPYEDRMMIQIAFEKAKVRAINKKEQYESELSKLQ